MRTSEATLRKRQRRDDGASTSTGIGRQAQANHGRMGGVKARVPPVETRAPNALTPQLCTRRPT
eukprot:366098-Chlamydomonas_euryale.AAC.5